MRTYRQLFAVPEFRVLFATGSLMVMAGSVTSLALGTIMFTATGSPVLTALSMFGGPLVKVVGSSFLLSLSDLLRPRQAILISEATLVLTCLLQAIPGLDWGWRFVLIALPWLVSTAVAGSGIALIADILPEDAFVLGRSTMNTAVGVMQIAGYGVGGALVLMLGPTRLFLAAAAMGVVAIVLLRLGLDDHPPRDLARGVVGRTRTVNRALLGSPLLRPVFLCLWVPNGIIVGCEALFVPYAGDLAGWLFAAGAAGMLLGDVVIGRFVPAATRERLVEPLRLLLAAPYLLFLLEPALPLACLLAFVASIGFAASLPLQERLLEHTEERQRGQVFGLNSTGLMVMQGVGALLGGGIAQVVGHGSSGVALTMSALAALSLAVTLSLTRGLRRSAPGPVAASSPDRVGVAGPREE